MKQFFLILPLVAVAGCTSPSLQGIFGTPIDEGAVATPEETVPTTLDPTLPPPPPSDARTVDQFDTTTEEDRAEAQVIQASATERELGMTIASLGSPTDPGIWLKTPLVTALSEGRIEYKGTSINVELRPSGGAAGSGSQISLAAMRLIDAPLTSLPELTVFAKN